MPPSRFRALLATLRIANMPSVVCNVWLGIALALLVEPNLDLSTQANSFITTIVAGLLLYAAGNLLNDWKDRTWDQTHRPERALPRGLFQPSAYLAAAVICLALAIGFASITATASAITAAIIAANILIYTHWHKTHKWAVIPMGICRALLPVMGFCAFAVFPSPYDFLPLDFIDHLPIGIRNPLWRYLPSIAWILPHSFAILFYIIGLTLSARAESRPTPSSGESWIARALLITSLIAMASHWMRMYPAATCTALAPFAIWLILCLTLFKHPVPKHVSALLAGIPLLDWIALLTLAIVSLNHYNGQGELAWFIATCLLLPPLAFLSGLLLQRIAPAT